MNRTYGVVFFSATLSAIACGGSKTDSRYPALPEGCPVELFHGKVQTAKYDDIGRGDAICAKDIGVDACMQELKRQTCKLGGNIVYDVPDDPETPTPDKVRYTGRVAHTRAAR